MTLRPIGLLAADNPIVNKTVVDAREAAFSVRGVVHEAYLHDGQPVGRII